MFRRSTSCRVRPAPKRVGGRYDKRDGAARREAREPTAATTQAISAKPFCATVRSSLQAICLVKFEIRSHAPSGIEADTPNQSDALCEVNSLIHWLPDQGSNKGPAD